jgi:hypothetical protein
MCLTSIIIVTNSPHFTWSLPILRGTSRGKILVEGGGDRHKVDTPLMAIYGILVFGSKFFDNIFSDENIFGNFLDEKLMI